MNFANYNRNVNLLRQFLQFEIKQIFSSLTSESYFEIQLEKSYILKLLESKLRKEYFDLSMGDIQYYSKIIATSKCYFIRYRHSKQVLIILVAVYYSKISLLYFGVRPTKVVFIFFHLSDSPDFKLIKPKIELKMWAH